MIFVLNCVYCWRDWLNGLRHHSKNWEVLVQTQMSAQLEFESQPHYEAPGDLASI